MAQNLLFDPVKKDYIVLNGSSVPSDRIEEACYYALSVPQGKWMYAAQNQGSLLYTLENTKRNASVEQRFAAYSNDAIKRQVVAAGKATDVATKNLSTSRTGTSNQIEVIPAQTQLSNQLNFVSV